MSSSAPYPSDWKRLGARLGVATLYEAAGDNLWRHEAVRTVQPDQAIVVAFDGHADGGHWGEVLSLGGPHTSRRRPSNPRVCPGL